MVFVALAAVVTLSRRHRAGHRASLSRERRVVALGALFAVVCVAGAAPASGNAATPGCDAIRVSESRLESDAFFSVTVESGHVSCGTARGMLGRLLAGGGVQHGGPYAYQEWWTLDGWRCGFGAGAASCERAGATISTEWVADECGHRPAGATAPCIRPPRTAQLWATVDECSVMSPPDLIGVRGSMPGDADSQSTMFMRFGLQALDAATGGWVDVPYEGTRFMKVGAAGTTRQAGTTFELEPAGSEGDNDLRGLVEYQWRVGSHVIFSASRLTTAGHDAEAGAEPPGFSAATCSIG